MIRHAIIVAVYIYDCTERQLSDQLKTSDTGQQQSTDDPHHHLVVCHQDHQHIDDQLSTLSLQVALFTHSFNMAGRGARRIFLQGGGKAGDHSSNIFLLCVDVVLYTRSHCN